MTMIFLNDGQNQNKFIDKSATILSQMLMRFIEQHFARVIF